MRQSIDTRTADEIRIDDRYNEMIVRVLGAEALDIPILSTRDTLLVDDGSDLGYQFCEPLSKDEEQNQIEIVRLAAKRSYDAFPIEQN